MMTLHRYPVHAADLLRRQVDSLFGGFLDEPFFARRVSVFPALNVWEDGERLFAEAEIPGLKMDDIEVSVVGKQLTIKGVRPTETGDKATYHRRERGNGEFSRTVTLPVEIDAAKVEATLKGGVLTITLPKAETAKPRKITVRSV